MTSRDHDDEEGREHIGRPSQQSRDLIQFQESQQDIDAHGSEHVMKEHGPEIMDAQFMNETQEYAGKVYELGVHETAKGRHAGKDIGLPEGVIPFL